MKKLTDKTAIITGAGRGIGKATAELFAREGANLILIARTAAELQNTADSCLRKNVQVVWKTADLAYREQIDELFDEIGKNFSRLDILINNAARFDRGRMTEFGIDRLQLMLDVNLIAPLYLAQKTIAMMNPEKGGTIVNISSYSGCFNVSKFPEFGAYNISKYALWGLTEILALENRDKNIRVNQLSPSGVDTWMLQQAMGSRVGAEFKPEEVAEKILYLACDDSAPMTGRNIMMPDI